MLAFLLLEAEEFGIVSDDEMMLTLMFVLIVLTLRYYLYTCFTGWRLIVNTSGLSNDIVKSVTEYRGCGKNSQLRRNKMRT